MKDSAVFIHDNETGKKYHVAWPSVAKVDGKDAADVLAKQAARSGKGRHTSWATLREQLSTY